MIDPTRYRFTSSVLSFPDRGPWGKKEYRGNVSGYVIAGFLAHYHSDPKGLFVDPMEGGGTSRDVAAEFGIRYQGFDLKQGFNILEQDLRSKLEEMAHTIFVHPPYKDMIGYGGKPGEDLSTFPDMFEFFEMCQLALMNVYRALRPGGHYAVLMGNQRFQGQFYPLASRLAQYSPGVQVMELVKVQHNTYSGRGGFSATSGSFVPTLHEILSIYQKPENMTYLIDIVVAKDTGYSKMVEGTWRNTVRMAMMGQGTMTLSQIYKRLEGSPKTQNNPNWQAKIRQVVQTFPEFKHVSTGAYQIGMSIQ